MSNIDESEVINAEERLRLAMLASDVGTLDELLASSILITSHLGELLKKEDDLAAHKAGLFQINELTPSEQQIQLYGEVAIVSVRMQVSESYNHTPANGDFRYTRVWAISPGGALQIIAAHIGLIT